jgi:hypothetical protein
VRPEKTPHKLTIHNPTMSLNLALSLLRQGRNGEQILQILETIAADSAECAE